MNFIKKLLSHLHFYRNLHSVIDERLRANELMTLSDFYEFHYSRLSQLATESGVSHEQFVSGKQLIVSLTSHGSRILNAYLAIESIMQGTIKPNRIILWLPEGKKTESHFLQNQIKRGLEIRYVKDHGPHTKLIPALKEFPEDIIITIDDDMFYRPDMVENLLRAYWEDPLSIHANRIALITKDKHGNLDSYLNWKQYIHPESTTNKNVIIGCEGCLYPPHTLSNEVFNSEVFLDICPTADDIWFTAMALLEGTSIVHVDSHYENGCAGGIMNLRMQSSGLVHLNENPEECLNDRQIQQVFGRYNLYTVIG